jgi:hypothetical protein
MDPEKKALGIAIFNEQGKKIGTLTASNLPDDVAPGEFVNFSHGGVSTWFVFSNKQRFWNGSSWQLSGSIQAFDPNQMTEQEIYELRRRILFKEGYIG